jgi:phosphoribosylformimino-5-aminoimidazole carboxamide ribotide isomerase
MIVFPAIDMRNGKCVRLRQGRTEQETIYFEDPVAVAEQWQSEGAEWLHLVDLDGAMSSGANNRGTAKKIFQTLTIPVQFGGGVRKMSDLQEVLQLGASRVVLGTAAVEDFDFLSKAVARFSDQIVVGLDARDGLIATKGWKQVEQLQALEFAKTLSRTGLLRIVYTDISRDGTLTGPNLETTRQVAESSGLKVIASGGMSSLEDLRRLKPLEVCGVEGVIIGKALYERRFSLRQALALVAKFQK